MALAQALLPLDQPLPAEPGLAVRRPLPVTIPIEPEWARVLAAPIFSPTRRPAPGEIGLPGGGPLSGYAAIGAATGGAAASAVVIQPGGQVRVVRLGEELDGWRVAAIGRGRLTFEKKGVRHDLVVGALPESATQPAASTVTTSEP